MFEPLPWFFWLFIAAYLFHFSLELFLDFLNLRNLRQHRHSIPGVFKKVFNLEDYQKALAYTESKTHFRWAEATVGVLVLALFLSTGLFQKLWNYVSNLLPNAPLTQQVAYLLAFGALSYLISLPFQIYNTFRLEARFGFNQSTIKTFVMDQVKGLVLALIIGVPLLYLVFKIISVMGSQWWWAAWLVWFSFQLIMTVLFPILLLPIFYKLKPLEEGSLRNKIQHLADQVAWKTTGIFTLDASRRSSHSNAFFTGFGKTKRIFLFDTLIQNLSEDEITAVVAHEMGHSEKKHVLKGFILNSFVSLLGFALLAKIMQWPAFYQAFGVSDKQPSIALVLFSIAIPAFTFFWTPIMNAWSRRHEYEADEFSRELTHQPQDLADALLKLSRDNLSNLNPHPWYSFYHYSHPTTPERLAKLKADSPQI